MPKHDLFFIWAGDAPPEWGKEGYKNLQKNFGSHYDLHFMYELLLPSVRIRCSRRASALCTGRCGTASRARCRVRFR